MRRGVRDADGVRAKWKGDFNLTARPKDIYARTRGQGLLKSRDGGKSWQTANKGAGSEFALAARSVAVSPHDPDVVLRGGGANVGGELKSGLWRSADGGDSCLILRWQKVFQTGLHLKITFNGVKCLVY